MYIFLTSKIDNIENGIKDSDDINNGPIKVLGTTPGNSK